MVRHGLYESQSVNSHDHCIYIYIHLCANIHYVVTSYFLILYMYIDLALLY